MEQETVETDEKLNWPAKIVDGQLVITPISETIKHPCGRQDVVLKVPSLELIKEFKAANDIQ
jgi:hypothetical protein